MLKRFVFAGLQRTGLTLLAFRLRELSLQLDYRARRRNRRYASGVGPDGLPLPGPRLITLVAGTPDVGWFLESGKTFTNSVRSILSRNQVDIDSFQTMLDFGCGCGRTLRHWSDLEGVQIHGTDYNADLIEWCRDNLPFATFRVNDLEPPLDYPDGTFDFIYAFSVFTHLPEDLQLRWIAELRRVLKPGGYLLITTHGDWHVDYLEESEVAMYRSGNMVVRHEDVAGTNLCSTFHPREYLSSTLLTGFDIVEHASVAADETGGVMQDMTLARLTE